MAISYLFDFDGTLYIDKKIPKETQDALNLAKKHEVNYILIDDKYEVDIEL